MTPALTGHARPLGDPDAARTAASRLHATAERHEAAARDLQARAQAASRGWQGRAATSAQLRLVALADAARAAGRRSAEAADALRACAAQLDEAHARWETAERLERLDAIEQLTSPEADLALRRQSQRTAAEAVEIADEAVRRAAAALRELAHERTPDPAAWLGTQLVGVGRGAVDSVWGSVVALAELSVPRALADPAGWREDAQALGEGAAYAVDHPGEALKALAGWETLEDGRYGEWLGGLLPDALAGLASGGALPFARRGAETAEELAELAEDVDDLQRVHDAPVVRPPSGTGGPSRVDPSVPGAEHLPSVIQDLTPERRRHILDGDPPTPSGKLPGGHRNGTGRAGKTEFPAEWDDDTIIDIVMDTAMHPSEVQASGTRVYAFAEHDGVRVQVVLESDGRVVTAFPLEDGVRIIMNKKGGA